MEICQITYEQQQTAGIPVCRTASHSSLENIFLQIHFSLKVYTEGLVLIKERKMLTLLFKRSGWNMFGVKIIAALQDSAKKNIAFL